MDGGEYVDVLGTAFLIGPGLALTARHNVDIFRENFERAQRRGETRGVLQMLAVQTWMAPAATIVHRVARWFSAPWTDLAVLKLQPALDQAEPLPENYRWRSVRLNLLAPAVGTSLAAFGFDQVEVTRTEESLAIRARGVTTTGLVIEVLDPIPGNVHHGWPRFHTNARFDGGMSGGPVIQDGLACGVVSASLPATSEDEDHASFVPLLWPAMAIEVDDPRVPGPDAPSVTVLELARAGIVSARGHERVELSLSDGGRVTGVGLWDR